MQFENVVLQPYSCINMSNIQRQISVLVFVIYIITIVKRLSILLDIVVFSVVKSSVNGWKLDYKSQKSHGVTGCIEGRGDFFQQHSSFFLGYCQGNQIRIRLFIIRTDLCEQLRSIGVSVFCSHSLKTRKLPTAVVRR